MSKDDIERRLEGVSQEERDAAQAKLDVLADQYDLKGVKIDDVNGKWRELCFRMCGIPYEEKHSKRGGRETKFTDDEAWEILQYLFVQKEFFSQNYVDSAKELSDKYDFSPEVYNNEYGHDIRNVLKNFFASRYKGLLKKQGKEDYDIDPTAEQLAKAYPDEYAFYMKRKRKN